VLLAIDTSAGTSVAVVDLTRGVITERGTSDTMRHAEVIGRLIQECLTEAGVPISALSGVVGGMGPGPFTGLRVGIASAAAFADALGVPAHGVCSLDGIAAGPAGAEGAAPLLVVTDARRREVYWAAYPDGRRTHGPAVDSPAALAELVPGLDVRLVAGTKAEELAESLGLAVHPACRPTAAGLVAAGSAVLREVSDPPPLEPMYLRRPDAVPPGARKRVTV
jgi:tRNA threonylcarbamoyl adenosine modification protein YeaZ